MQQQQELFATATGASMPSWLDHVHLHTKLTFFNMCRYTLHMMCQIRVFKAVVPS
eukprot:m.287593 g.287593  ORF g.287593 m.287593 type:complete len:55 (-) comp19950_c0_seq2:555-719(-)